jgi:hypothetical protein
VLKHRYGGIRRVSAEAGITPQALKQMLGH